MSEKGAMGEKDIAQKTILVLGGSYAGLSAAHYFLKHVLPALPNKESYNVTLVNPSSQFWSRPSAPRGVVSHKLMPLESSFYDIAGGFAKYPEGQFTFLEGTATAMDPTSRTVTVELATTKEAQTIPYYALILATGTRPYSPLLGMHTTHQLGQEAQKAFHAALPTAETIVIAGGGPAGVETAGELAYELNGTAGWFSSKPPHPKAKITVVTSDSKLLPALRPALAKKAEKILAKMGVDVIYNTRVQSVVPVNAGSEDPETLDLSTVTTKTTVTLANGETLSADLYIPATGVKPNTSFVPKTLLNERGYVSNNPATLRVDAAGPLVYAIGDCGSYTRGGVMDIYDAVPVLLTNVKRDLLAPEGEAPKGSDRPYKANMKETQIVPVGRSKGVGAIFGWKVPSIFVWLIKGRDYFASMTPPIVDGSKWNKESKWKMDA